MRQIFLTVLLAFWAAQSFAATYHVSPSGNDTNPGSQVSPWRTLQRAADVMLPGDTTLVSPGYYSGRVETQRDGTASARITFRGTGQWPLTQSWGINHSFVTVDRFSVTGGVSSACMSLATTVRHAWVFNNWIHHSPIGTYGIMFNKSGLATDGAAGNCIVSNNFISYLGQYQLGLGGRSNLITRNTFDNSRSRDAIHLFGEYNTISRNVFTNLNNDPNISDHPDCFQVIGQLPHASRHILIEGNLFINNKTQLMQSNAAGNAEVYDWTFRNNIIINQSLGMNVNIPKVKIYNNTWYESTKGIRSASVTFSHYAPSDENGLRGAAIEGEVINNIFFDCGGGAFTGWAILAASPAYLASNAVDSVRYPYKLVRKNNYASGDATNPVAKKREPDFSNQNLDSINGGDPRFVDESRLDLRLLRQFSPLVGAGIPLNFTSDYDQNQRPLNGSWDMGAYQVPPEGEAPPPPGNLSVTGS